MIGNTYHSRSSTSRLDNRLRDGETRASTRDLSRDENTETWWDRDRCRGSAWDYGGWNACCDCFSGRSVDCYNEFRYLIKVEIYIAYVRSSNGHACRSREREFQLKDCMHKQLHN